MGDGLMAISYLVILLAPIIWLMSHTATLIGANTTLRPLGVLEAASRLWIRIFD
jgi:hypothetical protein